MHKNIPQRQRLCKDRPDTETQTLTRLRTEQNPQKTNGNTQKRSQTHRNSGTLAQPRYVLSLRRYRTGRNSAIPKPPRGPAIKVDLPFTPVPGSWIRKLKSRF